MLKWRLLSKKTQGNREEAGLSLGRHKYIYHAIKEENEEHVYPIVALCKLGKVSRGAYYKWLHREIPEVAKCIDNGPMEGFWSILKRERYYGNRFASRVYLLANRFHFFNCLLDGKQFS